MAMTPEGKVKKVVVAQLKALGAYLLLPCYRWVWQERSA
jgi:hypothetical protein